MYLYEKMEIDIAIAWRNTAPNIPQKPNVRNKNTDNAGKQEYFFTPNPKESMIITATATINTATSSPKKNLLNTLHHISYLLFPNKYFKSTLSKT